MNPKWRRQIFATVPFLLLSLFLGLWAFWWEPGRILVREIELTLPATTGLPDGLRMALLADLHVGSHRNGLAQLERNIQLTNNARPDLVVLLGDYLVTGVVGGSKILPEPIAEALGKLRSPGGTVAVLGNHDWWFDGNRTRKALEAAGIRVLENETISIHVRGKTVWLGGLADLITRQPDIPGVLRNASPNEPLILLTHGPDVFPQVPETISLTLAGHTHGGQVKLPFLGRLIVPSAFGERYAAGHIQESGRHLFVTTGIGTSILPVRFCVPPEIVILTIRVKAKGE